ncbi:MAG TPA: hypothetical protein VF334_17830 [Polyangia bacterium]
MARAIAVDDSGIYFSTNTDPGNVGSFLRAPLAGGTAVALGSGSIFAIVVNDAAVFTLDGGGQILRWAKSGGPPVTLVSGSRFLPAVQIADAFGYLYWTTDDADFIQIFRRPDDGSGATARIGAMAGSGPIAFDSTHLWQSTTHGIFRSAPDGSGQTRAITSPNGDTFGPLAVDDAHVFVGTVPGRLWAADSRVGATLTLIASTSGSAVELLADGGRLYVRDSMASRSRITRYAADGSGATVLADRAGGIGGMAIHGGFLYYTSTDDSTVYRVCK